MGLQETPGTSDNAVTTSMFHVPCILVSCSYVLLTMFLAEALRKSVGATLKDGLVKIAILEFVAAAEMCGCGFELIIIADNYGVLAYSVFLFTLTIWWSRQWGPATACPYLQMEDVVAGSMDIVEAVVRIISEVAGGLLVFRYIQVLWSLELAETHHGRSHSAAFDNCTADLQVPVLYGAIIEGVATMLCRLTSKYLSETEPEYATAIDSFVATSLVVAAFDYSGGYYNPVLATSLKFGCRGHTHMDHVAVYWVGASLGALASAFIYPIIRGKKKED